MLHLLQLLDLVLSATTPGQVHVVQATLQDSLVVISSMTCMHPLLAGYVMWFGLLLGYPFATYWPRMAKCIRGTFVGRVLNNFTYFSVTHIAMWVIFYVALILHPYPGTPSQHKNGRSTTWVRLSCLLTLAPVQQHPNAAARVEPPPSASDFEEPAFR